MEVISLWHRLKHGEDGDFQFNNMRFLAASIPILRSCFWWEGRATLLLEEPNTAKMQSGYMFSLFWKENQLNMSRRKWLSTGHWQNNGLICWIYRSVNTGSLPINHLSPAPLISQHQTFLRCLVSTGVGKERRMWENPAFWVWTVWFHVWTTNYQLFFWQTSALWTIKVVD